MRSSVVLMLTTFTATTFALTDMENLPPPTSISGVGLGDIIGHLSGSGLSTVDLPEVTVSCGAMCRAQGTVIYHPNGNDKIFVGGTGPAAVDPRQSGGGGDTPAEQEEKKKKCLANCATQDTVNRNNCTVSNTQFRGRVASVPIWAGVAGGFIGGLLSKGPGAAGGFLGAAMLAQADIDARVKDHMAFCLSVAANDNTNCIKKICHAWLFAPFFLLSRRIRREDEEDLASPAA